MVLVFVYLVFPEVYSLQRYSTDLGRRIKQCKSDALRESRQGEKRAAVVAMRTMKHYQAARDSRLASLLTLETALDKVGPQDTGMHRHGCTALGIDSCASVKRVVVSIIATSQLCTTVSLNIYVYI